jgi:hypothetical protein
LQYINNNAVCIGYENISRMIFSGRWLQYMYHYLVMDMIQCQPKADIKHESACVCFAEAGISLIKTYLNARCCHMCQYIWGCTMFLGFPVWSSFCEVCDCRYYVYGNDNRPIKLHCGWCYYEANEVQYCEFCSELSSCWFYVFH